MKTKEQKVELIEKAIDAIMEAVEHISESDAMYFLNSENSVVSRLREVQYDVENEQFESLRGLRLTKTK